jgi:uncharacterized protein YjiS (DUF1127 family)
MNPTCKEKEGIKMSTHEKTVSVHLPKTVRRFHLRTILRYLAQARAARLQRLHLLRLDDAALRDIGLTRDMVANEASRPIWDAPAHWRK